MTPTVGARSRPSRTQLWTLPHPDGITTFAIGEAGIWNYPLNVTRECRALILEGTGVQLAYRATIYEAPVVDVGWVRQGVGTWAIYADDC